MIWICVVPPIPLLLLSLSFEGAGAAGDSLAHIDARRASPASSIWRSSRRSSAAAIWGFLLERYSPSVVAPFSLLVPIFGLVSGALVLGERLTALDLAATALILAGLACATARPASWRTVLAVKARASQ